jgi:hypothetical protein
MKRICIFLTLGASAMRSRATSDWNKARLN